MIVGWMISVQRGSETASYPRVPSSRMRIFSSAGSLRRVTCRVRRIKRSSAAKEEFMRQSGYPHGRKGYVVDHIVPLACGGADDPSNMPWQTEAKAKAKWERKGCK